MTRPFLSQNDDELLASCKVHTYRASGPGGQHRNKTDSAVRLHHGPTGITATAADTRSQHENRILATKRLRMNLALRRREPASPPDGPRPSVLDECIFVPRKKTSGAVKRLEVGRKDIRFWHVAAIILDMLDAETGRLSPVARRLEISTGNLVSLLKSDRRLLSGAQDIRRAHGQRPLT
jgi:hypothetical protein